MAHQSDLIASNIEEYLKVHENKELLRFITCGSVDDGKSTLIGRLLHDSKMIFEDQLASLEKDSQKSGSAGGELDLALLVDGLASEREQGITIDVAYRFFSTDKRKFIIADTPGHEQYTRNMATGASTANMAVILIDARKGVLTQTRRHTFIVNLLGIRHIIVAINKMDAVDYKEEIFESIKKDYTDFAEELGLSNVRYVPMSALKGDNVVHQSEHMSWYKGEPLMQILENTDIVHDRNFEQLRLPVQWVNRPHLDFRGFSGTLVSGTIAPGMSVRVHPSEKVSRVKEVWDYDKKLEQAFVPMAVTVTLEDEIDISRGSVITSADDNAKMADAFEVTVIWMSEEPLRLNESYYIRHSGNTIEARIVDIDYRIDVNTMEHLQSKTLELNDIARCRLELSRPVLFDSYNQNRDMGSMIIIDRINNNTVGVVLIVSETEKSKPENSQISDFEVELNQLIRKYFPHWDAKDIREIIR